MIEFVSAEAFWALGAGMGFLGGTLLWKRRGECGPDADFEAFIENINEGYYRTSLDGKQLYGNQALVRLNGYETEKEFLSGVKDIATEWYVDPKRRDEFKYLLEENGFVENFVSEIYRHKSRERIWISENARLVSDASGRPQYYEGTVREFTDTMKRLELEDLHYKLAEQVPGVLIQARWSAEGKFTIPYCSSGFQKLFGELPGDIENDASFLFRLLHPDDFEGFVSSAERSASKLVPWFYEFRVRAKGNHEIWIQVNATPEREPDGSCLWHGFMMDVTEKKSAERRIHSLAYYDPLTDLPNRRMLLDRIKSAISAAHTTRARSAVLFIDLDNFKTLNDTRGHGFGDKLLVHAANRLRSCLSPNASVGRLGGDEFLVLLSDLGSDDRVAAQKAGVLADQIVRSIDEPCQIDGGLFHPTCSVGIAMIDATINHTYEVLKSADTAMYCAKDNGKNGYRFYDEKMKDDLEEAVDMMADLRTAIGTNQLALHYQMQVNGQGKIVGAEGLLRWTHPIRGAVSPGQFIPLAEQNGLILLMTEWLLREAMETLASWSDIPWLDDVRISVNISAQQFQEETFIDLIKHLLDQYDVEPGLLVLEMTEHVFTGDLLQTKSVMQALKALGVGFSLDDFGTGYSSLTQLRDLPFDEVKIDGSFISKLEANDSDRAIVRSILGMAKALELTTVAEWVENEIQWEFLQSEGCDVMQGFLFGGAVSRPLFEETARLPLFSRYREETEANQMAGAG